MDREALIRRLMATFVGELEDHVRALNRDLLLLEKQPTGVARKELFDTLFRTAHSLKGAARSVNVSVIEMTCHRLEEIITAVRDGRLGTSQELFRLLFATADAIGETGKQLTRSPDLSRSPLSELLGPLEDSARGRLDAFQPRSADEPPPTFASAVPAPSTSSNLVRVPTERLDALLAHSSELLVALRRVQSHTEEAETLQDYVRRYQADWRTSCRMRRRGSSRLAPSRQAETIGASKRSPKRAVLTLEHHKDRLQQFGDDLAQLTKGLAADQRVLAQTASSLESEVRQARMLPFAEVCQGLDRAVRDLAKAGGKDAELDIEGADVEIDRSILEGLKDPLLHLVRNAVDHGIEPAAVRRASGKPARGKIFVQASLHASRVHITVADDGRGLDVKAIREQARQRGLPEPVDGDIAGLIFAPGLSTASAVTEVSGRGVGLDVARSQVEALRGSIAVASDAGRGTRFELSLPLTLTTIRALIVSAGGQSFAFDSSSVQAIQRVERGDLRSIGGREVVLLESGPTPIVSLAGALGLSTETPPRTKSKEPVVVLSEGNRQAAFLVDDLVAELEVLVKSLGVRLLRVRHVSAATVLSTGRIALILNASDLIRTARGHKPTGTLSSLLAVAPMRARKRLLVVDDSITTRTLVTSILETAGYEVLAAVDGMDAWRVLQEQGADLVVTDVEMPRMDGFALTEMIRGSKRFRDLPVILVTALETAKDKERGLQAGADAYLVKSGFDQQTLLDAIAQLL